ncbi:MAG: YbaB/EbfC family nucleoid-associated protein [Nocardioidaceae bacterium]|nr:YbaB/EbfC family nucleoid-associated protein [Nocardioidaceae bacterium]
MSNDPFDGAGLPGGLDLGGLLQQAQQMQAELQEAQQRLAESTVEGTVAGGAVTVSMTGAGEVTAVQISPAALTTLDPEALTDLGDLVVAALRDARNKLDALAQEAMGPFAGGMPDLGSMLGQGGAPGETPGQAPGKLGF